MYHESSCDGYPYEIKTRASVKLLLTTGQLIRSFYIAIEFDSNIRLIPYQTVVYNEWSEQKQLF